MHGAIAVIEKRPSSSGKCIHVAPFFVELPPVRRVAIRVDKESHHQDRLTAALEAPAADLAGAPGLSQYPLRDPATCDAVAPRFMYRRHKPKAVVPIRMKRRRLG